MKGKIVKSEFGRNVLTLLTGSTLAQILPIALTPILTRLFSPDEFGVFALYMSMITFLSVIASLRYEQAIILPKHDKEAINVVGLSFLILTGFTLLIVVLLLLFANRFEALLDKPVLNWWLWFLPVCVFLTGLYRILTLWNNRKKRFKGTSYSIMANSGSRISVQLIGGGIKSADSIRLGLTDWIKHIFSKNYVMPVEVTPVGVGSLILSYMVSFFIGSLVLLFPFFKKDRNLLQLINQSDMGKQARIHDKFPKINTLHAMGDEFKNIGVNSTLIYAFSDAILGFYSLTYRVLRAPLTVIGNSFAQVFFQKAAEMHSHGQNILGLVNSTIKKLAIIALPIFIVILLFGPALFGFVFGEKWTIAGEYAQYLTPWLYLNFVISPVQQVAVIYNKQGQIFILSIVGNLIIVGSILLGGFYFKDVKNGFLLLSGLQVFYYLYIYLWIKSIVKEDK